MEPNLMSHFESKLVISCAVIFLTAASLSLYLPELAALFLSSTTHGIVAEATSIETRQRLFAAAITAPQICSAIGAPLCGAFSDRYGRKRSLIVALSGAVLAMSLCTISIILHHALMLMAALALLGLMDGSGVIVQAGLLEESPPEQHASAIGKLTACSILGVMCGPLIGGLTSDERILKFSTYYLPFLMTAGLFAVATGIVTVWYKEGACKPPPDRTHGPGYFKELLDTIRLARIRRFVYLLFLMEIVIACFYQRLPLLLQQHHAGPSSLGLFGAYIASLIAFTCAVVVPAIPTSIPVRISMTGSFLLLAFAGALLLRQPAVPRLWLSGLPFAVGAGIIYCLSTARITEWTSPSDQGKLAGITISISALAFLVAGVAMASSVGSEMLSSAMIPAVAFIGICVAASRGPLHRYYSDPSPSTSSLT
ncbi:MAG: hypothetical protein C5B54_12345 [Acidobacteria bacterium]|nr:MAG: hypothetical protein C5B54_12345 [Acidobacteriota bacterium]